MSPARQRVGWVIAVVIIAVGLAYSVGGERLVQSATPDADGCAGSGDIPTRESDRQTRRATLCLLNARRAEAGLRPLRPSDTLARAARAHSEDMGERRYFAHDTPDGDDPTYRMVAAGYPDAGVVVGENLAWGEESAGTPTEIVKGWMNSPGHRANILNGEFTEIGIGLAHEPPEPVPGRVTVYTTDFGGRSR